MVRLTHPPSRAADSVEVPSAPIAPRTTVNVLVAAVLTLLALLGIAVLSDALGRRPQTNDQTDASRLSETSAASPASVLNTPV